MAILNFQNNNLKFNESIIQELTNNSYDGKIPSFRNISCDYLFKNKGYYIFKNFISKNLAINLRDYYTSKKMEKVFFKTDSSKRIFYYLKSNFKYPKLIKDLILNIMDFKNMIYQWHDYYQIYCMINKLNPKNFRLVTESMSYHTWQSVYWYKNGSQFKEHVDYYGELACFLILSKKSIDYNSGGLEIKYSNGKSILLDDEYDYGDLVFIDQSKYLHKVNEIVTEGNQIGRIQIYIPTIPMNYIDKHFFFEGELLPHFSDKNINFLYKLKTFLKYLFVKKKIHYSRFKFYHEEINFN